MKYLKKILGFVGETIVWYCLLSLVGFTALVTCISPTYGRIALIGAVIIILTSDLGELIYKKFENNKDENSEKEE